MHSITVAIADPKKASRLKCSRLLRHAKGVRVLAQARSGREALACAALTPRVFLLDIDLYAEYGRSLLLAFRRSSPRTQVILLTDNRSEARVLNGLAHGARGYLEKQLLEKWLRKALRKVDAGEVWVARRMVATLLARLIHLSATRRRR